MPVRRVVVTTTLAVLLVVGACGGASEQDGPSVSAGDDAAVDEQDLQLVLATAPAVSKILGVDYLELDGDELEQVDSDVITSGDESCGTYLDGDYGPPAQMEVGRELENEFGVSTISQYATLYDDADQAQELLDETQDLLESCRGFAIAVPAGEFEVTVGPTPALSDVAVDDADELIGAQLVFVEAGSPTGAVFSIELRIARVGAVAVLVTFQENGAGGSEAANDIVAAVARRANRLGVGG